MTVADQAGAPLRSAPLPPRPSAPHPSPTTTTHQLPTSPSTVHASPLSTPHLQPLPTAAAHALRTPDTPKQRARLACVVCRKSKVKCTLVEDSDFTKPCVNCAKGGKRCEWPSATTTGTTTTTTTTTTANTANPTASTTSTLKTRLDSHHPALLDRLPEPKKRKKALAQEIKSEADADLYDPSLFSEQVWKELYSIYKQHYITELPFLHEASFLPMLKQADIQCLPDSFAPLVLALLSLTVPFHHGLVRSLSQRGRLNAIQISRIYADAADQKIYETRALDHPSIRLVQALLMLSLHAHGDGQGSKSSITLGNAITCMQLLGCHYEKELDDMADSIKRPVSQSRPDPSTTVVEENFIVEEIKRRTFWSCYIVDRYISSGDYKPRRIHVKDALVQMPCSQDAFLHGIYRIKTRMLRETDEHFNHRRKEYGKAHAKEDDVEWEDEDKQEPLVWYIKALDLYEDVMKWACTVTRRNEKDPPWIKTYIDKHDKFGGSTKKEKRLSFANLDERLTKFTESLPAKLRLTKPRTLAHISGQTSTPFILLHSVLALCNIVLHREWLPFLPNPDSGPTGPVDGPNCHEFKQRAYQEKPKFWEQSAARCFEATKNVLDLMWLGKEHQALVETPFTSFVLFTVVCTIMWCGFFPYMDTKHFVCSGKGQPDVIENFDKAAELLHSMQKQLGMASIWCKISKEYVPTLIEARKHWKCTVGSPGSGPADNDNRGLNLYKPVEMKLKSFGPQPNNDTANQESAIMNLTDILQALEDSLKRTNSGAMDDIKSENNTAADEATGANSASERPLYPDICFTSVNAGTAGNAGNVLKGTNEQFVPKASHTPPAFPPRTMHKNSQTPMPHDLHPYPGPLSSIAETQQHFSPILPRNGYGLVGQEEMSAKFDSYPQAENVAAYTMSWEGFNWNQVTDTSSQVFSGSNPVILPYSDMYGIHGYYST